MRHAFPLLALLALACGGPPPETAEPEPTAGGEAQAEPVPEGPPASYVTAEHHVLVVIDMTRVRESPVGGDIGSLIRSYPTWRELLGSSGIDPVRDFDRALIAAPGALTGQGILLLRHHLDDADIRERVLRMAVSGGETAAWRQERGFSVVDWPAQTDPPRIVVLTGPGELVVCTAQDLPRVLDVASDHRARRRASETSEPIEPALALGDAVIASVRADEVSGSMASRFEHPPEAFDLELREDGSREQLALAAHARYADDGAAVAAANYLSRQRDYYADQMLVRAVGLDRLLREARIETEGSRLDVGATFTVEEMQRVLGLVALGQIGGS